MKSATIKKRKKFILRLVKLTELIWPKRELNMTETDKPYLLEHDRKLTTTDFNLLSLTESDWIWPNNMVFSIFGHIHMITLVVVRFFWLSSSSHFLSYSVFGHVQIFRSNSYGQIELVKWITLFILWTLSFFVLLYNM